MKKMLWIVLAVMLFAVLPVQALAGGWAFIAEHHHSRDGKHFEAHTFRGDVCTQCGYVRGQGGGNFNETILDNSCWVHYDCPLYSEPGGWRIGTAEQITNYYVGDYVYRGNTMWVLLKQRADSYAPMIGWVEASNLRIDGSGHVVNGDVIGCEIVATCSSGRGRQGPGTEYAYLETIHFGEHYRILDQTIGSNGNTWYKIRVDGRQVWIAAGLTELVK